MGRLPIIGWCCYKAENDLRLTGTVHVHTTTQTVRKLLSFAKLWIISDQLSIQLNDRAPNDSQLFQDESNIADFGSAG